jgi:single-stranded-DNA-specific exonuclease
MGVPVEHVVRWSAPDRDKAQEQVLQKALGIPSLVASVLVSRGLTTPDDAAAFLNPSLDDLGDPEKLPDYIAARDHILGARERKETIFVHGDYDVDGVTSAALLTRFLESIGCKVVPHVPHRMKEGYGIHLSAVEAARASGAKLFLTCDCGVSAFEQIEAARAAGMVVVVTDHHSIGHCLPNAHAIVNPHRSDSEYPFKELCGVGIAFRLCEGLAVELGFKKEHYRRAFIDLAVLGTVADVMPLIGENRIITRHGLKQLAVTKKTGLQALLKESHVLEESNGKLRAYHIGFVLGPRLNASGRIDDAARSLDLLLTKDRTEASKIAKEIEEINRARKDEQNRMVDEAVKRVLEEGLHLKNAIVIGQEAWHAGIIGLVAGRLVEQFRRPTFVVTIDSESGIARGSARSIPGFNLADVIRDHTHLVSGGGHAMAAGFSTTVDRLEEVAAAFECYASARLTEKDFEVAVSVSACVEPEEVNFASVSALQMLEPFGCANPEPLFCTEGLTFTRILPTKNPVHARVVLRAGEGPLIQATAFSMGERLAAMEAGFNAQLLFQPRIDEWRGNKTMKWDIRHFVPELATSPL